MAYFNAQGQGRVGWRSGVSAAPAPVTVSTLLTSLYSVWNGDTTTSTLDSSIYGAWNGENNANDSVSTNHGTLMNGCTFTTGKIGQAFTFDGVNDYIALPNNSFNSVLTGDFTVSLWVYLTSVSGNQTITCNMSSPSANVYNGWELRMVGSTPTFKMWNNTATSLDLAGSSLSINTWYNIVLTRKYGTGSKIYINSTLSNSNTNTSNPSVSGTFYPSIGTLLYDGSNRFYYLANGSKVDAVNIWAKAISDDEVTQLYNLGTGTQYPFSGQTLPSANNQFAIDNATLMNGTTFTDGKIGKAFTFDGVNDYVALPNNSLNFTGDFAISVWIYPTSGNVQCLLDNLALDNTSLYKGWQFDINNISGAQSGKITFTIPQTYTTYTGWQFNTTALTLNSWNHVLIQRVSGVNTYCWVNGVSQTYTLSGPGADITKDPIYHTTQIVTLGSFKKLDSSIGNLLKAGTKIDGLSVWQKSLSQAEVTELYNSGAGKQLTVATPIVTNGLVLNLDASRLSSYPNAGTTWTDISGNGNNGTMTNGPIFGTANGGVITFDGINDYIDMGINTAYNLTNISVSVWVKLSTGTPGYSPIISRYSSGVSSLQGWLIYYSVSTSKFQVAGRENSSAFLSFPSTNTYSINNWYNVTWTKSASTWSLYINGVLDRTATIGNGTTAYLSNNMQIGGSHEWVIADRYYGKQDIGGAQIYNRALSSTEITQNYNATKSRFGL